MVGHRIDPSWWTHWLQTKHISETLVLLDLFDGGSSDRSLMVDPSTANKTHRWNISTVRSVWWWVRCGTMGHRIDPSWWTHRLQTKHIGETLALLDLFDGGSSDRSLMVDPLTANKTHRWNISTVRSVWWWVIGSIPHGGPIDCKQNT